MHFGTVLACPKKFTKIASSALLSTRGVIESLALFGEFEVASLLFCKVFVVEQAIVPIENKMIKEKI